MTASSAARTERSSERDVAAVLAPQHGRFLAFLTPRLKHQASATAPDAQLHNRVCECVREVASTLRPNYASILNDVDVEGLSVEESARRAHISASNASVRLHRARKALAARLAQVCGVCATHRCVDCDCRPESRAKS